MRRQKPKPNLSWCRIWRLVWTPSGLGIVWLQGLNAAGEKGRKHNKNNLEVLECLLVGARWKGNCFIPIPSTWPSALFLSAVRHSPFPAANNTSLHVLVSRDRVGSTLHYCCLSVAVTPISSQSVHMLPSPAPLLHWLKKKKGDRLFTKFRNSVLETVSVLKEATGGCSEFGLLIFSNMNAAAVSFLMNFGLLENNSRHFKFVFLIPFYLFLQEKI